MGSSAPLSAREEGSRGHQVHLSFLVTRLDWSTKMLHDCEQRRGEVVGVDQPVLVIAVCLPVFLDNFSGTVGSGGVGATKPG